MRRLPGIASSLLPVRRRPLRNRGTFAIAGLALAALVTACSSSSGSPSPLAGSGTVSTETRSVGAFTIVEVRHGIRVELQVGSPARVDVVAQQNLLPIVVVSVAESRLTVDATRDFTSTNGITVRITVPAISELALIGGANGTASGVAGGALRLRAEGGSQLRVTGATKSLAITIKGGGVLDLAALAAEEATVDLAGGAKVTLTASRSVTGTAVGGAVVVVKGNPATVAVEATGGAAVVRQ